jgi:hypothetical protein
MLRARSSGTVTNGQPAADEESVGRARLRPSEAEYIPDFLQAQEKLKRLRAEGRVKI